MLIPESLWVPSHKDVVAQFAPVRVMRLVNAAGASTVVSINLYTVPKDSVLLLTNFQIWASGAPPNLVQDVRWVILSTEVGAIITADIRRHRPEAPTSYGLNSPPSEWSGQLILLPGEIVRAQADYNSAVGQNLLSASMFGVLIPRGNWQIE